jgi:SAM-dependent methyltransferase
MGGLFPEQLDLIDAARVLDLGCGPGGWTNEVAFRHPDIAERPYILKASYGAPLHSSTWKNLELMFPLLKPFMMQAKIVEEAEYDELYNQMLADLAREDFLSISFGLTAWAKKPQ